MAHRFSYKPTGIRLSSQIDDLPIAVDGTFVDVQIEAPYGQLVLSERYYAYNGSVSLYDIGSLIEAYMRSSGYTYADFTFKLLNASGGTDDTLTLSVLYCDRYTVCTDVPTFLKENFLTTLDHRRIAPDDTLSLFFFASQGETLSYEVVVRWRMVGYEKINLHKITLKQDEMVASSSVMQFNCAQPSWKLALSKIHSLSVNEIEIVGYTLFIGKRSVTCYVDRSMSQYNCFMFRNAFNVWDVLTLPTTTTAKTEVERSTAVVNSTSSFYNQQVVKTYEVECGPLTSDEAEWIDQLLTSYEVRRMVANAVDDTEPWMLEEVLITDSDCEISDSDEPNTVKFTWRYADNRPEVRLSISKGIFSNSFDNVYS